MCLKAHQFSVKHGLSKCRIGAWWSFTGRPHPGEDEVKKRLRSFKSIWFKVLASLKRLASGVLTHPVTIGQMIDKHTPKRIKDKPKSIHLMGTDRPEARIFVCFWP